MLRRTEVIKFRAQLTERVALERASQAKGQPMSTLLREATSLVANEAVNPGRLRADLVLVRSLSNRLSQAARLAQPSPEATAMPEVAAAMRLVTKRHLP
jgi:hypothetical protein